MGRQECFKNGEKSRTKAKTASQKILLFLCMCVERQKSKERKRKTKSIQRVIRTEREMKRERVEQLDR